MSALSQPVVQRSGIERRTRVRVISTICLVIIVCGLVLLSAMVGQYRVEAADVIKIVFGRSPLTPWPSRCCGRSAFRALFLAC